MLDLSQYQQIIFDFDGVILDSNQIKSNAFSNSLIDEDKELVKLFIAFHKKNGGISRFKKFDYFFNTIKNQKTYQKTSNVILRGKHRIPSQKSIKMYTFSLFIDTR